MIHRDVTARDQGESDELGRQMRHALDWWGSYSNEPEERAATLHFMKGAE